MALCPQTHADTGVDALLNKLEQKGILTVDEAKQLKAENEMDSANDMKKAFDQKFPMADWIKSMKIYGDFRGRFDDVTTETPAFGGNDNNMRFRYRIRMGVTLNLEDNLEVGFRVGSGDSPGATGGTTGGTPLSNNTTFQANGSKKFLYVDAAYGSWTPINNGTWMVKGTIGKMNEPFQQSAMVFDPDYTPEGAALQATYKLNDKNEFVANAAGFVIDQVNTRGPFLLGAQAIWNAKWTHQIESSLGIAGYDIANQSHFAAGSKPYDSNLGNTIAGGAFASHFNPIVLSGSVAYTLDSFPLYKGAFPIRVGGEYLNNPAAANNNQGWWAGVTFGKIGKKGTWDISYRYQRLEADAWWDQIVDDDNVALFPTSTTAGAAAGGTNIKGHLIKADYAITDALTFSFTCYINDLINNPVSGANSSAVHAMADVMWKF